MKNLAILSLLLSFFLISCGSDSNNTGSSAESFEEIENKNISGVAQIGPFEKGTTVGIYELDEDFLQTGRNYQTEIETDWGEYSVKIKKLKTPYALLKADGYYNSYITGKKTKDRITLYAFTDLSEHNNININVITHLTYKRMMYLVSTQNISLTEAEKKATSEISKIFKIEDDFTPASNLDFFGEDKQSSTFFALSILMQGELSLTDIEKRLDNFAQDLEKDGMLDSNKIAVIADWAYLQYIYSKNEAIRSNIEKQHPTASIPSFETEMDNFWWQNYGLGSCTDKRKNEVLKNANSQSEYSGKLFICRPPIWRPASDEEIQKYYWPDDMKKIKGKEGDVYQSKIDSTACYVYEGNWRKGYLEDCTRGLQGCTKERQFEIKKGTDDWYICNDQKWIGWHSEEINIHDKKWNISITNKKDTAGWKSAKQGTIRKGQKSDIVYIFDNKTWRLATIPEATLGGCTAEIQDSIGYAEMRNGQFFIDSIAARCIAWQSPWYHCLEDIPTDGYYSCDRKDCSTPFYQNGYYHCDDGKWHWVDECFVEMKKLDTQKAKDGDSQWGKKCPSKCYVFERDSSESSRGSWRFGDLTECVLGLGGCTKKRKSETGLGPHIEITSGCNGYCWKYIKPLNKDAPRDESYYCKYEEYDSRHEWL